MSWNFEFIAKDKAAARRQVESPAVYAPGLVKDFVLAALDGLRDDGRAVMVKSAGHLCEKGSYEVSTNDTRVMPVTLIDPPLPPTAA